ncbi:MAG TPA: Glu/Leu/Phe/Val dehydrogenase dimerization domain-containing protein [Gaiellaceae bacterium]|nr:Glu/Leu/Phe/Val dehydrogenase dimerization domain-containing protein [Gaiellaceae bacterium]
MFEDLLQGWDGEEAVIRFDAASGAWMFVCIHSTALGPGGGGTRMRVYDTPADGLADAMKLSGAMTRKFAAADIPRGGGKAVLAVPELPQGDARRTLLLRYGELVASLGGTYRTAGDMNISPADLDVVAERCPWVYGTTGKGGNSARGTAIGTLHAIRATIEHLAGSPSLAGVRVLVQGAGAVGADLVRLLQAEGADVLVSDVDEARAVQTGATVVAAADVIGTECEVYSPCAVGGTLNAETIPRLRCRAVAGCANNQLAEPADGDRLHAAGILYAPDYVANAGGVIQLVGLEDLDWSEDELQQGLAKIGDTLRTLFRSAAEEGITPAAAAERLAADRVAAAAQIQAGR